MWVFFFSPIPQVFIIYWISLLLVFLLQCKSDIFCLFVVWDTKVVCPVAQKSKSTHLHDKLHNLRFHLCLQHKQMLAQCTPKFNTFQGLPALHIMKPCYRTLVRKLNECYWYIFFFQTLQIACIVSLGSNSRQKVNLRPAVNSNRE